MQRRSFLKSSSIALVGAATVQATKSEVPTLFDYGPTPSLNAYSFNKELRDGSLSLNGLFQFAAQTGFSAVDLTAYYIAGYPEIPSDELLYEIKRKAFRNGVSLSGTGVRNDFTVNGQEELASEIEHVKQWIVSASKLGAPNIRVFDGKAQQTTKPTEILKKQVVDAFRECARFGSKYGVSVAFQNHNEFIVSADDIIDIIQRVNSEWFGLMLDTDSVAGPDPYGEIDRLIPYATTWQLKENVQSGIGTAPVDIDKILELIHKHQYRGFIPMETLGEGDPKKKIRNLFEQYQKASPI